MFHICMYILFSIFVFGFSRKKKKKQQMFTFSPQFSIFIFCPPKNKIFGYFVVCFCFQKFLHIYIFVNKYIFFISKWKMSSCEISRKNQYEHVRKIDWITFEGDGWRIKNVTYFVTNKQTSAHAQGKNISTTGYLEKCDILIWPENVIYFIIYGKNEHKQTNYMTREKSNVIIIFNFVEITISQKCDHTSELHLFNIYFLTIFKISYM